MAEWALVSGPGISSPRPPSRTNSAGIATRRNVTKRKVTRTRWAVGLLLLDCSERFERLILPDPRSERVNDNDMKYSENEQAVSQREMD